MIFQRVEFKVDKIIIDYKKQGRKWVNNRFIRRKTENHDSQFSSSLHSKILKWLIESQVVRICVNVRSGLSTALDNTDGEGCSITHILTL